MVRKFVLCAILALVTSFAPVVPPKPTSTVVRSEPPKTSTPPINRATALSGGLLGGYLLLELGYVRSVWKLTSESGAAHRHAVEQTLERDASSMAWILTR